MLFVPLRVQRKIPGPTRVEEVGTGDNCITMNLMMCTHIILFIKIRQMRLVGEYDTYFGEEACKEVSFGKHERRKPLRRPRCKCQGGNIKIVLQKVGQSAGPEWSDLEYGQVVGYCDWGNDPLVSINCNFSMTWSHISFSRRTLLHEVS